MKSPSEELSYGRLHCAVLDDPESVWEELRTINSRGRDREPDVPPRARLIDQFEQLLAECPEIKPTVASACASR